jgi:hypothetical protein
VLLPLLGTVLSDMGKEWLSKVPVGSIAEMRWFYPATFILTGLTVGAWLDWLLRAFDGGRAEERKKLGREFLALLQSVENAQEEDPKNWPHNLKRMYGEIEACVHAASTYRIWAPGKRIFSHPTGGPYFLTLYLNLIGTLLSKGHFRHARHEARRFETWYKTDYPDGELQRQPPQEPQQTTRHVTPPADRATPPQPSGSTRLSDLTKMRTELDTKLAKLRNDRPRMQETH